MPNSPKELPKTLQSSELALSSKLSAQDLWLRVIKGPHEGESIPLEREISRIGRAEWCDLVLDQDQWASSEHCECWLDPKGVRIRDLGSRNGIVLGGYPVFDAFLTEGAVFTVGTSSIQLASSEGSPTREISIRYHDKSRLLVGKSNAMRKLFSLLEKLGKRKVNTLLTGETGTGKTTVARAIHHQSGDRHAPFVVVNCGALPSSLIEAELFGYEKGAFTGADQSHAGYFEQAHGGTLFLDEIAELPLELQPKLLDVIERRRIRRIGGTQEVEVEVRLVTATHRKLPRLVEQGQFREDLYFRISVVELEIPPLRERSEDIPLLIAALLLDLDPQHPIEVSEEAQRILVDHVWPGNIRQLRNTLERSITFLEGHVIGVDDLTLPFSDFPEGPPSQPLGGKTIEIPEFHGADEGLTPEAAAIFVPSLFPFREQHPPFDLKQFLSRVEKALVVQALEENEQNVQKASRQLGISAAWLYNRIKKYELSAGKSSS